MDDNLLDALAGRLVALTGLPHLFLRLLGSIDDTGVPLADQTPDAARAKNQKILEQIAQLESTINAHAATLSASNPAAQRQALLAFQGKVDAVRAVLAVETSPAMASTIVGQTLTLNMAKINPVMSTAMTGEHTAAHEAALLKWLTDLDTAGQKVGAHWQMSAAKSAQKALKKAETADAQAAARARISQIEQDRSAAMHGFADRLEKRQQTLASQENDLKLAPGSKWAIAREKAAPKVAARVSSRAAALQAVNEALLALKGHKFYHDSWTGKIGSDGIGAGFGEAQEYANDPAAREFMSGLQAWKGLKEAAEYLYYLDPKTKTPKPALAALTYVEVLSLVAYTSNLYKDINNQRRFSTALSSMGFTNYVAVAAGALNKLPSIKGFGFRHDGFAAYITARQNGTTFADAGFFSVAMTHEGTIGGANHDVLTLLMYSNGKEISDLSYYGHSQAEVLFPPGTRWLVERRYERPAAPKNSDDEFRALMDADMANPRPVHPLLTSHQLRAYNAGKHFAEDKHKSKLRVVLCVRQM